MASLKKAGWRVFAIIWAWTFGVVVGGFFLLLATIYGLMDLLSLVLRQGRLSVTFTVWIREYLVWQRKLHTFAFTGGQGFEIFPPLPDIQG